MPMSLPWLSAAFAVTGSPCSSPATSARHSSRLVNLVPNFCFHVKSPSRWFLSTETQKYKCSITEFHIFSIDFFMSAKRHANTDLSSCWRRSPKPSPGSEAADSGEGGAARSAVRVNHRYRGGTDLIRPATRATFRGPTGPISLKTVQWTVFRALDAPEGEGFGVRQPPFLLPAR